MVQMDALLTLLVVLSVCGRVFSWLSVRFSVFCKTKISNVQDTGHLHLHKNLFRNKTFPIDLDLFIQHDFTFDKFKIKGNLTFHYKQCLYYWSIEDLLLRGIPLCNGLNFGFQNGGMYNYLDLVPVITGTSDISDI